MKNAEDDVRDDPETLGVPADIHRRAEHLDETHYAQEHNLNSVEKAKP